MLCNSNSPYQIDIYLHGNLEDKHICILDHQTPLDMSSGSRKGCYDMDSEMKYIRIESAVKLATLISISTRAGYKLFKDCCGELFTLLSSSLLVH